MPVLTLKRSGNGRPKEMPHFWRGQTILTVLMKRSDQEKNEELLGVAVTKRTAEKLSENMGAVIFQVEQAAMAQAPLIDARLAAIDKQSNALAQVDIAIRDVLALYDQAVQQANPYQQMHMYAPVPQNTVHPPAITQQQQQYASQYMQNPMMQPAGAPNYQYQQQAPVPMQGAQPQYAPYPTFAQPQDWQAQQQQPIQPGVPSSAHNPY